MKKQNVWAVVLGSIGLSLSCFSADILNVGYDVPVVSNVQMTQDWDTRQVTITYDLAESVGIVTVDIRTNEVSIGARNFRNIAGDVNKEVETGSHIITWQPDKSWQGHRATNATVKIQAWAKSSPPDYMAVHLRSDSSNNLRWYTCEDALPEGIDSDLYRDSVLLMRRIYQPEGGEWLMGSSPEENGRLYAGGKETIHWAMLTNDYWMGVFEVTQKQWERLENSRPSSLQGENWAFRPVEKVSYNTIRGTGQEYHYPNPPDENSFLGKLRSLTGLPFDLPTEMQWEYACRAGTETALNNGKNLIHPKEKDPAMDEVGRYRDNGGQRKEGNGYVIDQGTARVGSYLPNAWGLYDMHGNVWEWCLDWQAADITELNGVPPATGAERIRRGGSCYSDASNCRSACRHHNIANTPCYYIGFRVACLVGK